jgi:profilin
MLTGTQLKDSEMKAIVSSFGDRSETKAIIANGLKVNDVKYMTIEAGEDSVKAKKVRHSSTTTSTSTFGNTNTTQGKEGIVVFKTTQALIIAHHPDSVQTPNAYNSVVELGEYLKKHGM